MCAQAEGPVFMCHPCRNALAFGENHKGYATPFIGTGDFALAHTTDRTVGDASWSMFLFHWAFSAAAATIMAGAIAERMTMQVYLGYTCLMTTLVRLRGSVCEHHAHSTNCH
jgi:ammonia channel protein AmtB